MEIDSIRVWGIHSRHDDILLNNGVIAIGWEEMGDLSKIEPTREAFRDKYVKVYPNEKKGAIPNQVGQLFRFCHEVSIGDYVVFPSKKLLLLKDGMNTETARTMAESRHAFMELYLAQYGKETSL